MVDKNKYRRERSKTPKGAAESRWGNIQKRVKNNDGRNPTYKNIELRMTRKEFMEWAIPEFEKWFENHPDIIPAISRLNKKGHYQLNNIWLISRRLSAQLQPLFNNVYAPKGMAWCNKCKDYQPMENFYGRRGRYKKVLDVCKTHRRKNKREIERALLRLKKLNEINQN